MNNGKVRIYELSKDLGVENRDILTICERLGIAAKSHSSTLTGDDAQRIRNAVKETSGKFLNKPAKPSPPRPRKPNTSAKETPRPRKQQILEIRRHRPKPAANPVPTPPATVEATMPASETASDPPSRPAAPLPKPKLKRPGSTAPERLAPPQAPVAKAEPSTEQVEDLAPTEAPAKPDLELVGPPARPAKPSKPSRPVLKKRDRSADRGDDSQPKRIEIREIDDEEETAPALKSKPELRRPRPKRA
ncbi:MAG: translation initiation factor IF-2 N-terminal domain-containing protein, partial [Cyanobacteria bacterium P01_H01_bin.153]